MVDSPHEKLAAFAHSLIPSAVAELTNGFDELVKSFRSDDQLRRIAGSQGITVVLNTDSDLLVQLRKQNKEFVTSAELRAEAIMRDCVRLRYPTHAIIGEELGSTEGSDITWVFDPVDGTSAMIRAAMSVAFEVPLPDPKPGFGLTIGVIENQTNIIGVIAELEADCNGLRNTHTWVGINDHHASVLPTSAPKLADAVVVSTVPLLMFGTSKNRWGQWLALQRATARTIEDRNCVGFVDLLRGEAHIAIETDLALPDVASLQPILQSAGFTVSDLDGNRLRFDEESQKGEYQILAAAPSLHAKALNIFRNGVPDDDNNFGDMHVTDNGYVKKF